MKPLAPAPSRALAGWLALCAVVGAAAAPKAGAVGPPERAPSAVLIRVDGSINPAVAEFVADSISDAARSDAAALIVELDTPGGLLTSAQRIVKSVLGSPVPVIVYVAPSGASAASAGMFITEAAHLAAMAPGTTIGAAHPVEAGGGATRGPMAQKMENFAASFARSIAEQRGRNSKWVEEAVRKSAALDEREALQTHVIDLIAPDLRDLLRQASGRQVKVGGQPRTLELTGAAVMRREMSISQRVLNTLSDPNLVYLLLMAGVIGLYFEFAHPGVFFPGVAGALCLLLALASFEIIPIDLSGLLLLLLGAGLLVAEVFYTSYGILGIGGVIAFVLGSLFLIDRSETNQIVSRPMIAGAAAGLTAIILGLGWIITRDRRARAQTGREGLIGEIGEVRERIAPDAPGRIFIHGEHWRAVAEEVIERGMRARVTGVDGMEVKVTRAG